MSFIPTPTEARKIMHEHIKEDFLRNHSETVAFVMGHFASELDPQNIDFWTTVGMLHDLDFEEFPDQHCVKTEEIMRGMDIDESIIKAVCSHGCTTTKTHYQPTLQMEKVLFAVDELTGLIWAAALMRPSKSCQDMELKSLKKKFKDKRFAAGCSRDVIKDGADRLGWELDELLERTLLAMREYEKFQEDSHE